MQSLNKSAALAAGICLLAGTLAPLPVSAEVSAERDDQGRYLRMIYRTNASVKNLKIWTVNRNTRKNLVALNPDGDTILDTWPQYVEDPYDGNRPYVVWSRFSGHDYDLVWSRWMDGRWSEVQWVERVMQTGVEQDPCLATQPDNGRPHLVWWSDEGGVGRVYLSIFLRTRWMARYLVSDLDVDSRYPVVEFETNNRIRVTYEAVDGPVSRVIVFNSPQTITDDIDPMTYLTRELQNTENGF